MSEELLSLYVSVLFLNAGIYHVLLSWGSISFFSCTLGKAQDEAKQVTLLTFSIAQQLQTFTGLASHHLSWAMLSLSVPTRDVFCCKMPVMVSRQLVFQLDQGWWALAPSSIGWTWPLRNLSHMSRCLSSSSHCQNALYPRKNQHTYLLNGCPTFWCYLGKIPVVSYLVVSSFHQTQASFDASFSRYPFLCLLCAIYPVKCKNRYSCPMSPYTRSTGSSTSCNTSEKALLWCNTRALSAFGKGQIQPQPHSFLWCLCVSRPLHPPMQGNRSIHFHIYVMVCMLWFALLHEAVICLIL